jgi:hypothetical protein
MKATFKVLCVTLIIALLQQVAFAQRAGKADVPTRRNQSGGINYAPLPGIFVVVSVDSYSRNVRLRAGDGTTADVHVAEDIYDLSKLKAGDRIQVDFLQRDGADDPLSAATVWPAP